MRRAILCTLIATVMSALSQGALAAAKDPGGALDLKWSQSDKELRDGGLCLGEPLVVDRTVKGEVTYLGSPEIAWSLPVLSVTYSFYQGKPFLATALFAGGEEAYAAAMLKLIEAYGAPNSAGKESATWVLGNTKVTLYQGESQTSAVVAYTPIFSEVAKLKGFVDQKAQGKKKGK